MYKLLTVFIVCVLSSDVFSRPVSYPDGWTFMSMNDGFKNSIHIHYSPSAKYSVGYKGEYWREDKSQTHAVQLNNLLKRWNKKHSQANLYLKSGLGFVYSNYQSFNSDIGPLVFAGIATDWETRKYFVSYENRFMKSKKIKNNFRQKGRVGIAPYIANFGELHTWLMLEIDHAPKEVNEFTVTPLIRLFKGPSLFETGYNSKGFFLFNFVYRF